MSSEDIRFNLPNLISLARLLSVPLTVWLILNEFHQAAFWIFVAACVSDAADGYIAKRYNLQTELGGFLDPIADKALLVSVFVTLGHEGLIDVWVVILVVFRDALIVCGAILYHLLYQNLYIEPLLVSKINTTAQFLMAGTVMSLAAFSLSSALVIDMMGFLVAATTLASGTAYVITWGRKAAELEPGE